MAGVVRRDGLREAEPGYRYVRDLVDKAADLIARDAGGYDGARWRDDPRNTAQAVFDLLMRVLDAVPDVPPDPPAAEVSE